MMRFRNHTFLSFGLLALCGLPRPSSGFTTTPQLAAGDGHVLAIQADGSVYACGVNDQGQVGNNTTQTVACPMLVPVSPSTLQSMTAVGAGHHHSAALKALTGTVCTWGDNTYGQIGNGVTGGNRSAPLCYMGVTAKSFGGNKAAAIAVGGDHALVLDSAGTVWSWGRNDQGQLGDGTFNNRNKPVPVLMNGIPLSNIASIGAGKNYSYAITTNGIVYLWGGMGLSDSNRKLYGFSSSPVDITSLLPSNFRSIPGKLRSIVSNDHFVFFLFDDGTGSGQLWRRIGIPASDRLAQVGTDPLSPLPKIKSLSNYIGHVLALGADGNVYAWGANDYGQLGKGDTDTSFLGFFQVTAPGGNNPWAVASGLNFSASLMPDGSYSFWGQLPWQGTTAAIPSQISVAPLASPAADIPGPVSASNSSGPGSGSDFYQTTPDTLKEIEVFPNPWRSDRHAATGGVIFNRIPDRSIIRLFTLSGRHIRTLDTNQSRQLWDLTNDVGERVASGIYLYLITNSVGQKLTGRLAVIH